MAKMSKLKQRLTEKIDALPALTVIAIFAAPVIWCAQTGTSFDYVMSVVIGGVLWFIFLWLALCLVIGVLGIISGR